ncbi:MAG: hypothetical protein QXS85_05890 [Acidilobaceae archaeon]
MLKLTLSPTARDLDRALEAAYKSLYQVLEASSAEGRLLVRVYPNLDPIVAGVIVATRALRAGVRVSFKTSLEPPLEIREPSVLVGYSKLDYSAQNVTKPMIAIASGSIDSIPVHGATFVGGQGSNTAVAALIATSGVFSAGTDIVSLALLGVYSGSYVDPVGRFAGLDRVLVDRLSASAPSLDVITTIKVYKPHLFDVCEAISRTAHPLYLGLAGNPWRCQEILGVEKYRSVAGKPLSSITDLKEVERLARLVLDYMHSSFKSRISAKDIVAGIMVSKSRESIVQDYREASDAVVYVSDAEKSLARAVATLLDYSIELPLAESRLELHAKSLSDAVIGGSIARLGGPQGPKVYLVSAKPEVSLTLLWRALKTHGLIEPDSILVVEENGELSASPIQIEEALGYGALRELARAGLVSFDGDRAWVERKALGAR